MANDQASGEALCFAAGWKKFEGAWNMVIRARQLGLMTPLLEAALSKLATDDALPAFNADQTSGEAACGIMTP